MFSVCVYSLQFQYASLVGFDMCLILKFTCAFSVCVLSVCLHNLYSQCVFTVVFLIDLIDLIEIFISLIKVCIDSNHFLLNGGRQICKD